MENGNNLKKLLELKTKYENDILIYQYNITQSRKNIQEITNLLKKICDHHYIIDRYNYDPHSPTLMICEKCETYK
jgi:hypothetical protein